jgi:hypothetical protein
MLFNGLPSLVHVQERVLFTLWLGFVVPVNCYTNSCLKIRYGIFPLDRIDQPRF